MKSWKKFTIALLCGIGLLVIAARLTGAFQYYNIPTPSSEPAVMMGQKIFTTNLRKPKKDDLVVYRHPKADSINLDVHAGTFGHVYFQRLCAIENDVIQMKGGVFYVNGKNTDLNKNLMSYYQVAAMDVEKLPINPDKYATVIPMTTGEYLVNLTDQQVANLTNIKLKRYNMGSDGADSSLFRWCNKQIEWTADDFGPLPVPPGCCFVMGDNRHNSLDSRWTGFVKLSDIAGIKM